MGYSGSATDWGRPFLEALSKDFFVISYDARGMGRSFSPDNAADYALSEQLKDIESVLDHWGLSTSYLLGYSYGGVIGHEWAHYKPERVEGIAYVSTTAGQKYYVAPEAETLLMLAKPPGETPIKKSEVIWRICLGEEKFQKHRQALQECFDALEGKLPRGIACREQLRIYGAFKWRAHPKAFKQLIVHGEEDFLAPVGNAYNIQKLIPEAKLKLLNGVAHMPHIECPEEFVTCLRDFLS